jgi:outer membrane protein OmpA-like peptidoglycan-associated protein
MLNNRVKMMEFVMHDGMAKANGLFVGLILSAAIVFQASASAVTPIHLRVDASVPLCTFDRTKAESLQVTPKTITGSFAIQCRPDASPYRMQTTLSPLASVTLLNATRHTVKWFVRHGAPACNGDIIHPESVPLHSGNISAELVGSEEKRVWSYCVQVEPVSSEIDVPIDAWPLQGELPLTLVDAKAGWVLPTGASRVMVRFENNHSKLSSNTKQIIDTLLMNMGTPESYQVHLHAHTSLVGDPAYNHDLSIMRLMRVREYVIGTHGINRLDTWGQAWGESRPAALNTVDEEEEQNRRVDMILLPRTAPTRPVVQVSSAPRLMTRD